MDAEGVSFSCEGAPRGKGRPRLSTRGGYARAYTDPLTVAYEASIRDIARKAMGDLPPFAGPLSLSAQFRMAVPVSISKRQRLRLLAGEEPYFGAFDLDNGLKSLMDSMNKVCFLDDKQVVRIFATKIAHTSPGIDVKLMCLEPQAT